MLIEIKIPANYVFKLKLMNTQDFNWPFLIAITSSFERADPKAIVLSVPSCL